MKVLKYISAIIAVLSFGASFANAQTPGELITPVASPSADTPIIINVVEKAPVAEGEEEGEAITAVAVEADGVITLTLTVVAGQYDLATDEAISSAVRAALRAIGYASSDLTVPLSSSIAAVRVKQAASQNLAEGAPDVILPSTNVAPESSTPGQSQGTAEGGSTVFPDNTIITSEE